MLTSFNVKIYVSGILRCQNLVISNLHEHANMTL